MSWGLREVKHLVKEGWERRELLGGSLALSVLFLFACRAYGVSLCVQQMPVVTWQDVKLRTFYP
jgi:hypothetical protein